MSDDWKPGDLALCVNGVVNPEWSDAAHPQQGAVYTVTEVTRTAPANSMFPRGMGLFLAGLSCASLWGFAAQRFRKINPLTDEERRQALEDLKLPQVHHA